MKTTTLIGIALVLAIVAAALLFVSSWGRQQKNLTIANFDECATAGNPIMPARRSSSSLRPSESNDLGAGGESYPEQCRTPDGRTFVRDISNDTSNGGARGSIVSNGCVVAGCSGQLCVSANEAGNIVTTCEYRAEYACYKEAHCGPQTDGTCGWSETPELQRCLTNPPAIDTNVVY